MYSTDLFDFLGCRLTWLEFLCHGAAFFLDATIKIKIQVLHFAPLYFQIELCSLLIPNQYEVNDACHSSRSFVSNVL